MTAASSAEIAVNKMCISFRRDYTTAGRRATIARGGEEMEAAQLTVQIWEKAVLTVDETVALTGIGRDVIRALAHHALHGPGDFPVFTVGTSLKIPRLSLLEWLSDAAACGRNLKRAEAAVEEAKKAAEGKRGRRRKVIGLVK